MAKKSVKVSKVKKTVKKKLTSARKTVRRAVKSSVKKVKKLKKVVAKSVKLAKPVKSTKATVRAVEKAAPIRKGKVSFEQFEDFQPEPILPKGPVKMTAFFVQQQKNLKDLRDHLLDQMQDVAQGNLRAAPETGGGAAFGQHMGDAGSDAYEKDFALSLLSQEQDSLYEIEEALKRIEQGVYGICEKCGKPIPKERLEAIPWARYTVDCQAEMEKSAKGRHKWESTPQFMDAADSEEEGEEEEVDEEAKVKVKE